MLVSLTTLGRNVRLLLESPRFVPICFIVFMAFRVCVVFIGPLAQTTDFSWYYLRAAAIAAGEGYSENGIPTAFWPVGWPAFLGAVFAVAGPSVLAGQLVNLVLSALVFVLTAATGSALFRDRMIGRGAVLILTLYPNQIAYVPLLSTEIFYEFLLLSSTLLLMRERILPAVLAGLILGLATLTKTQTLLLPGFILVGVFLGNPSRLALTRLATMACVVYVAMTIVIAPWTYRNYVVFDAFIPISTNGGWTLLTGNNPEANGDYTPDTVLAQGISHDPGKQVAMDRLARARAITWIQENPIDFLLLLPRKLVRLWVPDGEGEWYYQRGFALYDSYWLLFRLVRVLNQGYYVAIWLLAIPAGWLLLKSSAKASPWLSIGPWLCIYFSLISLAFSGQSRFHYCLMPYVAMYAAWSLVRVTRPVAQADLT